MTKDEALDLALEALEMVVVDVKTTPTAYEACRQAITAIKQARSAPVQEPVGCEGAIVNGRVYADRLEHDYTFECEAGPLHLCNDWVEFRRCFEWLAEHVTPPARPAPVQEPVAWPCVIAEADFEKNTITIEMQCSDYKVGVIDHINGNRSDNRITNLRDVTNTRNLLSFRKTNHNNSSGFIGVNKNHNGWRAEIKVNYQNINLGTYPTKEEASIAYSAVKLFLEKKSWVGLTDEDKELFELTGGKSDVLLAELVEAKLKEKNT